MKLTKSVVRNLTVPEGKKEIVVFDEKLPGFGIRLRAGGSRVWIYQYKLGKKHRRMTLGHVAALDPDKARKIAGDLHAKVRLGMDPQAEKFAARAAADQTLGALVEGYFADRKVRRYLRTIRKPLDELGGAGTTPAPKAEIADEQVLSFKEAVAIANISMSTLYREIEAGRGPLVTRMSRRRVGIRWGALRSWLASRDENPT